MEKKPIYPELEYSSADRISNLAAVILLGVGLWLVNSGLSMFPDQIPWSGSIPLNTLLWDLAVLFILAGALIIIVRSIGKLKNPEKIVSVFILPLIYAFGTAVVLILAEHLLRYVLFPYPLDDGEGFCLNQALRLASGQALYPPIDSLPYIVTNYPPVFPAILNFFINIENPSLITGRMISVISTIVLGLATAGCVRAATGDNRAGWIAALMILASPVIYFWGALLRVDLLATALGMVALWIAMSAGGPRVFWSLPFLLAAIFTRQSAVEAFIAIAIGLLSSREKGNNSGKYFLIFIISWVIGGLIVLFLLQNWSGGEFWKHTVTLTRTQFYPARILSAAEWILPVHALMFLLALFALPRALTDNRRRMLGIFFIASFATSLLAGKVGSDLNYYMNLITASACLTGLFAADLFSAFQKQKKIRLVAVMLLIPAALAQSGFIEGDRAWSFTPRSDSTQNDYRSGENIVEILSSVNGPILSEDEGFCLLAGHEVLFNPFIMSELAREKIWDQEPFVRAIEEKQFDLIMLRFDVNDPGHDDRPSVGTYAGWDRFTESMERAIADNYEIDFNISPIYMRRWWFIYRPVDTIPEPLDFESEIFQEGNIPVTEEDTPGEEETPRTTDLLDGG